ncbi:MAG: hypothetical protein OXU36_10515 [Candidatus Poribacteria bacterium]|nr:hypothetical protein [Candidatus Poribacteria bacterium]
MSSIDYRDIIEKTLPALAKQLAMLMEPIGKDHDFEYRVKHHGHYTKHVYLAPVPWQNSWRDQVDWTKPFHRTVRKVVGADGQISHEYTYNPVRLTSDSRPPNTLPDIVDECYITFRNLRVLDVLNQEYGKLDTTPTGTATTSVKTYPNDSPEPVTKELETSEKSWTQLDESWEVAVESEFSQTIKAGSELYGVESETSLKLTASYQQAQAKSGGKESSNMDKSTTTVDPFSTLEVVQTEQPVKLSQSIIVTGGLEVEVNWGLRRCYDETSATLEKLLNVFRGLGADNDFLTAWFSEDDHTVDEDKLEMVKTPVVTIDLGISDVPADQFSVAFRQRPIRSDDIDSDAQ